VLGAVLAVAVVAAAVVLVVHAAGGDDGRRAAAQRFARAWNRGDLRAMWRELSAQQQRAHPFKAFAAAYRSADSTAGVTSVRVGRAGPLRDDHVDVAVAARTKTFGVLRGRVAIPVATDGDRGVVRWDASLRLPGLRPGEHVRLREGPRPRRANVLAADGTRLASTALGASIAGTPPEGDKPATGLERLYDDRLAGHPSQQLRFGRRVVARAPARHGRSVHTTIRPGLMQKAAAALGDRLGGVAVLRPRDGSVLALAGLAVSAPQPPGSTFKIITVSAALTHHVATPSSTYPVRQFAVLSGVKLRNASDESCGGDLVTAFAESCNSVFAPLGAKVGAKDLVAMAEAFGFNEQPRIPAAKPSTIPAASQLKDALAVGASAIGQNRDLATPLGMASAAATIGEHGVRARPRLVRGAQPVIRHRAVSTHVARQVRAMMLEVVRAGTGTAAAIPGVQVAGKTGTAELRPTAGGPPDPKNTDAWFVAFAPATHPTAAVGVMLVGAGAGGKAAAPIARAVLEAALAR
jgi:hypothetical protein